MIGIKGKKTNKYMFFVIMVYLLFMCFAQALAILDPISNYLYRFGESWTQYGFKQGHESCNCAEQFLLLNCPD